MDIVERLREINALCETLFTDQSHTLVEAANEIERLQEALQQIYDLPLSHNHAEEIADWAIDIARTALKEGE